MGKTQGPVLREPFSQSERQISLCKQINGPQGTGLWQETHGRVMGAGWDGAGKSCGGLQDPGWVGREGFLEEGVSELRLEG